MANPNVNCLKGKRCPKCESYGPFNVVGEAVFLLSDDGTEDERDVGFHAKSSAWCKECGYAAKWKKFNDPEVKADEKA